MSLDQAQLLIAEVEAESTALVRLAELTSFAARVDPALLRRMRRKFLTGHDAGLEADLWFSPLVRFRTPKGIVFMPEVADLLRARLAQRPAEYEAAWQLTAELHRPTLSPAVFLEEEVYYLQHSRQPNAESRIRELIRSAVAALVLEDRRGLAHWAARALPRFPAEIRALEETRMLTTETHLRLELDLFTDSLLPDGALPDWVSSALPSNRYEVGLRLFPDYLEIGDPAVLAATDTVTLPKTDPLALEVSWEEQYDYDLYVSYSQRDKAAVNDIVERLQVELRLWRADLKFFVASSSIAGGEPRQSEIAGALTGSRFLLAVISPAALASDYLQQEWEAARSQGRTTPGRSRIIPVLLREVNLADAPAWLRQLQWVDLTRSRPLPKGYEQTEMVGEQLSELSEAVRTALAEPEIEVKSLTFQPGETRRVRVGPGQIWLRTLLGEQYELNRVNWGYVILPESDEEIAEALFKSILTVSADHGFETRRGDPYELSSIDWSKGPREIQQAQLVLADLSEPDPNVYYQLGYAHGLGKTALLSARSGTRIPLMLKQLVVIFFWEKPYALEDELKKWFDQARDRTTPPGAEIEPDPPPPERYYTPPDIVGQVGRELEPGPYGELLSRVRLGEVLIGLYRHKDGRLEATHLPSASRMKEMTAAGASNEGYFALRRAKADEGMKPPLPPENLIVILPSGDGRQIGGLNNNRIEQVTNISSGTMQVNTGGTQNYDDLYSNSIRSVGESFGIQVERVDLIETDEAMLPLIGGRIRDATVIAADLSHPDPNCFYELGYADALQKRVILSARVGTELPAVVQGREFIRYDSVSEHRSLLEQTLGSMGAKPDSSQMTLD